MSACLNSHDQKGSHKFYLYEAVFLQSNFTELEFQFTVASQCTIFPTVICLQFIFFLFFSHYKTVMIWTKSSVHRHRNTATKNEIPRNLCEKMRKRAIIDVVTEGTKVK